MKKEISCPECGKKTFYSVDNIYRPFCSERCRLIDLGQWAEQTYRVPCQDVDLEKNIFDTNNLYSDEN